jgi:hypothetical protein
MTDENQPLRLGFPVKVLGQAGLKSNDSRRWMGWQTRWKKRRRKLIDTASRIVYPRITRMNLRPFA